MKQYLPMNTISETRVLIGNKARQQTRATYESSVDIEHPVHVDETANPKWKRGQLCWEAKGKCAQDYNDMKTELLKELSQSRRESFCEVGISLFMIGKTPRKAKPIIIISSEDKTSREEAKKAIINSGVLTTSGFKIGILKYLPSGPIHSVARSSTEASPVSEAGEWNPDTSEDMAPVSSYHSPVPLPSSAYYDPEQQLRMTGMPIYVKMAAGRLRMATANVVHNGSTYGYITAAHVFSPWNRSSLSIDDGEDDIGIPFDSDSEDEDYCNEQRSFAGSLISESVRSTETELVCDESTILHDVTTSTLPGDSSELSSDSPSGLILLGKLSIGKGYETSLDYTIITIEDTELQQQLEILRVSNVKQAARASTSKSKQSMATAMTTHGLIHGKLTNAPILMRLPGSKVFQPIYAFAYEGTIQNGDSGSLVVDTGSKELYGMVIAASNKQPVAYIVGAEELLSDTAKAAWKLLDVDDGYMNPGERHNEMTSSYSQTAGVPQVVSSSIRTPQVVPFQKRNPQVASSLILTPQAVGSPTRSPRVESSWPTNYSPSVSSPTQTQPEWNIRFQRYLYTRWDEQYGRYYWQHYIEGQGWVFFDWVPMTHNIPQEQHEVPFGSHARSDSLRTVTSSTSGPAGYGRGEMIYGTYNTTNLQHYETLDPSFSVRGADFFEEGKVFSVLFTEPASANALNGLNPMPDYNTTLSKVKYDGYVHTQVRRFIVTKRKREFCFAVPVFSYGNRGTTKRGVIADEHAIAYSLGTEPQLVNGEAPLTKASIPIVMDSDAEPLAPASRIFFAIHHPIQYNVKVKSLGYVHPDYMPTFLGYWHQENFDSKQEIDVTQGPSNTHN